MFTGNTIWILTHGHVCIFQAKQQSTVNSLAWFDSQLTQLTLPFCPWSMLHCAFPKKSTWVCLFEGTPKMVFCLRLALRTNQRKTHPRVSVGHLGQEEVTPSEKSRPRLSASSLWWVPTKIEQPQRPSQSRICKNILFKTRMLRLTLVVSRF